MKIAANIRSFSSLLIRCCVFMAMLPSARVNGFSHLFGLKSTCQTIETVPDFNTTEYTQKTWYVQRMQPTSYLTIDRFYCVTATYSEGAKQYFQEAIAVDNYANSGAVNGPIYGTTICAIQANKKGTDPAKLVVSPCFLPPKFFGGPYWVASVASDYSWAIVVGGQPRVQGQCGASSETCTTNEPLGIPLISFLDQNQGLWFLTRDQIADNTTLDAMEAAADSLGICTANMLPVEQQGCLYEGSSHK